MLATCISLLVIAILFAVFGPRAFLISLGGFLMATLITVGKTLKVAFEILDFLSVIIDIFSLFS